MLVLKTCRIPICQLTERCRLNPNTLSLERCILPRPNTPDSPLPYSQGGNLQDFRLACFQFQLRLHGSLELPPYKGASFHGALGLALAKIGTRFRDFFTNPYRPHVGKPCTKNRPSLIS
jgi:hypothetical protein